MQCLTMTLKDSNREQIVADLQQVLIDGESLVDVTIGMAKVTGLGKRTERRGTLFVTDRRVGLFTKKIDGHDMLDFSNGLLTCIEYKESMLFGETSLLAVVDRRRSNEPGIRSAVVNLTITGW